MCSSWRKFIDDVVRVIWKNILLSYFPRFNESNLKNKTKWNFPLWSKQTQIIHNLKNKKFKAWIFTLPPKRTPVNRIKELFALMNRKAPFLEDNNFQIHSSEFNRVVVFDRRDRKYSCLQKR